MRQEAPRWFATVLPAIVFLSVITGGGFATGREVIQYCLRHGPGGALWVTVAVFVALTILLFLTIESARRFDVYDYRRWARVMLPRGGHVVLELVFVAMTVLVCAIVLSSASAVLETVALMPGAAGLLIAALLTFALTAVGRRAVIATKVVGALMLASGYVMFAIVTVEPDSVGRVFTDTGESGWAGSAMLYVGYNAVALPASLYAMRGIRSRGQAAIASLTAAVVTMIAFASVALTISTAESSIVRAEAPLHAVLRLQESPVLLAVYYAVFAWTLIDTGVGMIYAIVVRAEEAARERGASLTAGRRWIICATFLVISAAVAQFGLIPLIAQGYGTMAYFFIVVVVGPLVLFALGVYRGRLERLRVQKLD